MFLKYNPNLRLHRNRRAEHGLGEIHEVHAVEVVVNEKLKYIRDVRIVRLERLAGHNSLTQKRQRQSIK